MSGKSRSETSEFKLALFRISKGLIGIKRIFRRCKSEFLVQLDGAASNSSEDVLFLAATNAPSSLDAAVLRRFHRVFQVGGKRIAKYFNSLHFCVFPCISLLGGPPDFGGEVRDAEKEPI